MVVSQAMEEDDHKVNRDHGDLGDTEVADLLAYTKLFPLSTSPATRSHHP
jgi:hypothetical protein